jgi:hypothetical protein
MLGGTALGTAEAGAARTARAALVTLGRALVAVVLMLLIVMMVEETHG